MHILRCVGREFDAYRRYRRDGYTEWIIVLAIAGILLTAGDGICRWFLDLVAPSLANQFNAWEKGQRVLLVGAPCATIFLAATIGAHWWDARRPGNLQHYFRDLKDNDESSDN